MNNRESTGVGQVSNLPESLAASSTAQFLRNPAGWKPAPQVFPSATVRAQSYDVIVIGGGPAGATVATLLARQGHRVVLLERSSVPRFHIGESLMPETYWTLERLGMLEKLKASPFPRKHSVQFVNEHGQAARPFYFCETNPHESSATWQVWRADFDRMLLENARAHGVEVRSCSRVTDVLFDGDRAVAVETPDGEIRASVVVDASGQSSIIANRLKLRRSDPHLRKSSVWTYFKGARRDSGIDAGATIIFHVRDKKGWFWYIPLPDDIVSVGVVGSTDCLLNGRGEPELIYKQELDRCPAVFERVRDARRVGEFYVTKDFSYSTARSAGPGWVLVGDAIGFLDPIYSSGVFLALKSGEWAADAIDHALRIGDTSAEQLGRWVPRFKQGMDAMRKLVLAFYTPEFSFGAFLRRHPEQKKNLVDMLVGNVFQPGADEVIGHIEQMIALPT